MYLRQWLRFNVNGQHLFNDAPFDYFFLDTYFDTFYKEERQFASVFGFFSIIGVTITCMGLFGLSLFDTGSRTKEVGIRKSLGGSPSGIMWLFSKEYLKLICIASVISIPIGAWILNDWLKTYPQRIELGARYFRRAARPHDFDRGVHHRLSNL